MNYPYTLHHGAKGGVAGSCHHLLMDAQHSLLIDCRLFQRAETSVESKPAAQRLVTAFPLATIKALVATHVYIDHVGRIFYLLAAGSKRTILCSKPTAKLLPIVLVDAFKLSFSRDLKLVERQIQLIEQGFIALPRKIWLTLHDTQIRGRRDLKPFWDNEALRRVGHGNRLSGHRHRRERNILLRSNRQLSKS